MTDSAAAREPVADEARRAPRAGEHFSVDALHLRRDQPTIGYELVDLALDLDLRHGDIGLNRAPVGFRAQHIAAVRGFRAKRDRTTDHHREIIAVADMAEPYTAARIGDVTGFGQP